jgi:endoglucanase
MTSTSAAPRPLRGRLLARALGACLPLALLASVAAPQSAPTTGPAAPVVTDEVTDVAASTVYGRWAADPRNPTNPLADRTWGVYKGNQEQAWAPYAASTGLTRELLAKIALRPKSKWFGAWIKPADIASKVRSHIATAQDGDPEALVQLTTFALKPWEHDACKKLPTDAQKAFYRRWTDEFAKGIGDAHVALVLQADGPFALCAPGGSKIYSQLIAYSAKKLGSLPNTAVYIDAGAADWMRDSTAKAARLLIPAGVRYVRGFALNSTHYSPTEREVRFGAAVVAKLRQSGIYGKRFIVNTASNGRGFPGYEYKGSNFDNARVCSSLLDTVCVALGIPPTMDVDNPMWGLSDVAARKAATYCDAFMWFGRPWLYMQADPFDLQRALQLVRTSPYAAL